MEKPLEFKNGDDIHFNYSQTPVLNTHEHTAAKKKKKKKKKKVSRSDDHFSLNDATLNDPDADYPESRVIKVDSSGNIVVESLENAHPGDTLHTGAEVRRSDTAHDFSLFHFNNEDESNFWVNLPQEKKNEIVNVHPHTIMEKFHQQVKANRLLAHNGTENKLDSECRCPYCGRNNRYIEEELESAYREYLDEIVEYIGNLQPETLGKPKMEPVPPQISTSPEPIPQPEVPPPAQILEHTHVNGPPPTPSWMQGMDEFNLVLRKLELKKQQMPTFNEEERLRFQEMREEGARINEELRSRIMFAKGLRKELMDRYKDAANIPDYLLETLNFVDSTSPALEKSMELLTTLGDVFNGEISKDKVLQASDEINVFAELILKNDGRSFVDIVETLMRQEKEKKRIEEIDDDPELEHYALKLPTETADASDMEHLNHDEMQRQVVRAYREYHDRTLDHDFPEGHPQDDHTLNDDDNDEDDNDHRNHNDSRGHNHDHHEHDDPYHDRDDDHPVHDDEPDHDQYQDHYHEHDHDDNDEDEYGSEYDDDYDCHEDHNCDHHHECDHDCHHECDHDDHYDESEHESDEENEFARQKRIEEVRGFFMIQAVTLIRQRFREAYEKKISEDRTQKFIAELEAEENAKKEKELKKLKQKEKQKEKKRLQQLQKEEEKKRKEAEESARAAELQRKQDELRAEQIRRKEELRLKKEEEKLKKIEALKKKEIENQKLAEQQRAQEEQQRVEEEQRRKIQEEQRKKAAEAKAAKEKATKAAKEKAAKEKADKEKAAKEMASEHEERSKERRFESKKPPGLDMPKNREFVHMEADDRQMLAGNDAPQSEILPGNHLLDQLYQVRPRSASSTPSFTQSQSLASGSNYSPSKQNTLTLDMYLWNSGGNLLSLQLAANNTFSPFESGTGEQWPTKLDPFLISNPVLGNRSPAPGASVWGGGYSRNNSIWNTNPTPAGNSTIWANSVPQNGMGMRTDAFDVNSIQAATCDAFRAMQSSNQVTFGMAPALQLYQTTKTLLNHQTLGMAEFLNTLRTSGRYHFEFVYDDFGSVTHIKVNNSNTSPPSAMLLISMQLQLRPIHPIASQSLQQQSMLQPLQQLSMQQPLQQSIQPQGAQPQVMLQQPIQQQSMQPQSMQSMQPMQQTLQQPLQHLQSFRLGQGFANEVGDMNSFPKPLTEMGDYELGLPGSVQGLLSQLGFGQRGGIW